MLISNLGFIWSKSEAKPRGKFQGEGAKPRPKTKAAPSQEHTTSPFHNPRIPPLPSHNNADLTWKGSSTSLLAFIHHIGNKNSMELKIFTVK